MIEVNVSGGTMIDIHDDENTIEHILPQNPDASWDIEVFRIDQLVNRLGNLCLLKSGDNRLIGNASYDTKKSVYSESAYQTTRSIPEHYSEWNESTLNSRQKNMAHRATSIWRISI